VDFVAGVAVTVDVTETLVFFVAESTEGVLQKFYLQLTQRAGVMGMVAQALGALLIGVDRRESCSAKARFVKSSARFTEGIKPFLLLSSSNLSTILPCEEVSCAIRWISTRIITVPRSGFSLWCWLL